MNCSTISVPLRAGVLGVLVSLAAACDNPAGNRKTEPPAVRVLSGAGATDTAMAVLTQPLVVEVRDSTGRLRAGVPVRLQSGTAALDGVAYTAVLLSSATPNDFQAAVTALTDDLGRATVRVRLGRVATTAEVAISAVGLSTTAAFTVTPGAAERLTVAPLDTAVFAGSGYTLRVLAADQWGNAVTSSIAAAAPVTVSGSTVTGQSPGQGTLTVTAGAKTQSVNVTVVPQGALLAARSDGIYFVNLDGSGLRRVVAGTGLRSPRWFPNGQAFVYSAGLGHGWISDLNGTTRSLVQGANPLEAELWPHPSRDGAWVYFGGYGGVGFRGYPRRVRPDGTGLQLVPGFTADDFTQGHPSPSPTGDRVAYFREEGFSRNVTLRVLNMQTGQVLVRDVAGHSPEWSHGDSIAYLDMRGTTRGPIRLMSSAGQGHRQVGSGTAYDFGIDWSPDDQWIVARDANANRLEIIRVATGQRIPLPYSAGFSDPAWKP